MAWESGDPLELEWLTEQGKNEARKIDDFYNATFVGMRQEWDRIVRTLTQALLAMKKDPNTDLWTLYDRVTAPVSKTATSVSRIVQEDVLVPGKLSVGFTGSELPNVPVIKVSPYVKRAAMIEPEGVAAKQTKTRRRRKTMRRPGVSGKQRKGPVDRRREKGIRTTREGGMIPYYKPINSFLRKRDEIESWRILGYFARRRRFSEKLALERRRSLLLRHIRTSLWQRRKVL